MNWRRAAVSDYLSLAELSHLLIREKAGTVLGMLTEAVEKTLAARR